jgi:TonB family protein
LTGSSEYTIRAQILFGGKRRAVLWLPDEEFRMTRIVLAALATLLAVNLVETKAWVRNPDKQLGYEYADKVLTLRHFYTGDHLRFFADGRLRGDAPVGLWTLDGQVEIRDVRMQGRMLEISGRRKDLVFDPNNLSNHSPKPLDLLATLDNYSGKEREVLEKYLQQREVNIEIEMPSKKASKEDIASAIHTVFLVPADSMMDAVPDFWHAYFADVEGKKYEPPSSLGTVYRVEPHVISSPRKVNAPAPEYSDEARRAHLEGSVTLWLVVDAAGAPQDVQIQRPLGLGLDEKAVERIRTWTFEPGKKDGQPVPVKINIEVSFRLYER